MSDFLESMRSHISYLDDLNEEAFHLWQELPSLKHAEFLAGDYADNLRPRADYVMREARLLNQLLSTGEITDFFIEFLNDQMDTWFDRNGEHLLPHEYDEKHNFWTKKSLREWLKDQGYSLPKKK